MKIRYCNIRWDGKTRRKNVMMEVDPFEFGDELNEELIKTIVENEMENYANDLFYDYEYAKIISMTYAEKAYFIANYYRDKIVNFDELLAIVNKIDMYGFEDVDFTLAEKKEINFRFRDIFNHDYKTLVGCMCDWNRI